MTGFYPDPTCDYSTGGKYCIWVADIKQSVHVCLL